LTSAEELLTYLIVRLPATCAALEVVLSKLYPNNLKNWDLERVKAPGCEDPNQPNITNIEQVGIVEPRELSRSSKTNSSGYLGIPSIGTLLDLGAGPGTLSWASLAAWGHCPIITAIEREKKFIELGQQLGSQVEWIEADLLKVEKFEPHDWVCFGYSLSELQEEKLPSLFNKCWEAAQKGVIIVEPGTPRGYQRMLLARDFFVGLGGSVFAPCPHSRRCPLKSPDWCHFSVRLDRNFLHRRAKLATLPYEDEKFSYVILTKERCEQTHSRIIAPPQRRSGHTTLSLCTPEELKKVTFSRKQKELYKKARKASWGDQL
ncbi:MAG: hypothetical protein JSR80_01455, partial [Verrucomicrobia bacterium]|nr:hypothetical protein [Verrucomicrobiota bacterium]